MSTSKQLPTLPQATVNQLVALRGTSKEEFHALIKALRLENWPLRAIAEPFGVSRTAASDWEKAYDGATELPKVPSLPVVPVKERKSAYKKTELSADEAQDLLKLANLASEVRRYTDVSAPSRRAALELEGKLIEYANKGISRTQLAKYCGVSRSSIQQRLGKYDK